MIWRYASIGMAIGINGALCWFWPAAAVVNTPYPVCVLAVIGMSWIEGEMGYWAIRIGNEARRETERLNALLRAIGPSHTPLE